MCPGLKLRDLVLGKDSQARVTFYVYTFADSVFGFGSWGGGMVPFQAPSQRCSLKMLGMCLSLSELVCFCSVVWMTKDCSPNFRTASGGQKSVACFVL